MRALILFLLLLSIPFVAGRLLAEDHNIPEPREEENILEDAAPYYVWWESGPFIPWKVDMFVKAQWESYCRERYNGIPSWHNAERNGLRIKAMGCFPDKDTST